MKNLPITIASCQHKEHSGLSEQIECLMKYEPPKANIEEDKIIQIKNKTYKILDTIHKGNYGKLTVVEGEKGEVYYWKHMENGGNKLFKEAMLQTIAHSALKSYGLLWAVPEVESIFNHPEDGCGFLMTHPENTEVFANYLQRAINWSKVCEENDKIFIEVIAQLAMFLCILEDTLKMNHRDIKSTNVVLIQKSMTPLQLGYFSKGKRIILNTSLRTILIDFGFACIKNGDKIMAAGDYLPTLDGCPKEGRDLFVFLSHLWKVEAIRRCITPKLADWFRRTLTGEKKSWWQSIMKMTDTSLKIIYLYAASDLFSMPSCSPFNILTSLSSEFPSILTTSST